jgi:hypothetical protein
MAAALRIESFAAKSHAEVLGMCSASATDDTSLFLMEDAVMPLAHEEVEALQSVAVAAVSSPSPPTHALDRAQGKSRRECGTFTKNRRPRPQPCLKQKCELRR